MYQRMKMLLGGLILSMGLVVATPVSYAAETQVNGEEDIELAYVNVSKWCGIKKVDILFSRIS